MANIFGPSLNPSFAFEMPYTRLSNNNNNIFEEIKQMKQTAAHHRMSYLTSNQIEGLNRLFVVNKYVDMSERMDNNTSPMYLRP